MGETARETMAPLLECLNATGLPGAIAREVSAFFCIDDNWCLLKLAMEQLEGVESLVSIKVTEGENNLKNCDPRVKRWLNRAKLIPDSSLEDEYNKLESCGLFCNCTPDLPYRYYLGKKIVKKLESVNKLIDEEKMFTEFCVTPPPITVEQKPQTKTVGMEPMLTQLHEYFNNKEKSIIGVWGRGGVGKTTLLNAFNNGLKDKHSTAFHVVIAIDVSNSETLDVASIQRTITERLGIPWNDTVTEVARAKILIEALSRKRFVILLDDVWKKFRLEDVGIPTPTTDNNCKIVLASRDKQVCIEMDAHQSLIGMQLLDETASWELFKSNLCTDALEEMHTNSSVEACAKEITKKCGGLPLALNVVGTSMASLTSSSDWRDAMQDFNADIGHLDGVEDEVFLRLKYSYDKLDKPIQECFLYCTLFPENSSIKKDQLVEYWMAEGLVPPNNPIDGKRIIAKLLQVCLLESTNSDTKVRMHSVIHDFGLWLANRESSFLVQSGQAVDKPPQINLWQGPKKISLMSNDIKNILFSPNCTNLETLFLHNNPGLKKLDPNFFKFMSNLRVLDLSKTSILELPKCDSLVKLQYLNLSHTPIVYLPKRLKVLKELRHLDLSATKALKDTFDNCSKLTELRVLNLFRSNYGIRDVSDLNLDLLEHLKTLGIAIHAKSVLEKLKITDPLAISTHRLSLKECKGMKSIHIADFSKMGCLEELYIESCNDLSELVVDQDAAKVSQLEVLTLWYLPSLELILVRPLPHYFTNVRDLTIHECQKLNNISWVTNLKSLEKLAISSCHGMMEIVKEIPNGTQLEDTGPNRKSEIQHEGYITEFPKLRSIELSKLDKLESICNARDFPALESIRVQNCPNLKKLPIANKSTKLRQICGSLEWWKQLDWDDRETRESVEVFFTPYGSNGGH
ncbi:hypothetical protein LUZ60_016319 [Juncus effusus]|nr:hypothetical protein LUZ60_016319 [Juncus effusus]